MNAISGIGCRLQEAELDSHLGRLVREHEVLRACLWATRLLARTDTAGRLTRSAPVLAFVTGPRRTADVGLTVSPGFLGPQPRRVGVV